MRELILYHWHCILPVVGIVVAMFFLRHNDVDSKEKEKDDEYGKRENNT